MHIFQIVKRFGRVGGMEEFVWRLASAQVAADHSVTVVCEVLLDETPDGVDVVELGRVRERPRWRSHREFSKLIDQWARQTDLRGHVVHSHEMVDRADVFTFHSTLHGEGAEKMWWKRLDPSWHINRWLERRVLGSPAVKRIVPVSAMLGAQLAERFPGWAHKLASAVPPGIEPVGSRPARTANPVLGFMGHEWKRKGLEMALDIFRGVKEKRPDARMILGGVEPFVLKDLAGDLSEAVECLGWVDDKDTFYNRIRLLLHPARLEAFGMVVTEALTRGLPVIISDCTGSASEVDTGCGKVLSLDDPLDNWVEAALDFLTDDLERQISYHRSWEHVAGEYANVYRALSD